jgi:hypothetical protein
MSPQEKYGEEFFYRPFILKKSNGQTHQCHDVAVCIKPKEDQDSTLAYGWTVLRDLARWVADSFPTVSNEEGFRIIIAWSREVRPMQGHIFKVFHNREHIRLIGDYPTYQDYAKNFGGGFIPLPNWEKDVFKTK